jgi:serine/threonine protein kinase/tetratricopeptide (TPR) repeat protein
MKDMIGTLFNGRYRIEEELGHGGMGVIYRAQDTLLDRQVAIKVLGESGHNNLSNEGRARLLREAQAAARLNHPNIVAIYDAGQVDGSSYIVMELIEGRSLYALKPTSIEEIVSIYIQICAALAHAHAHGIIHRDLKPENVIVSEEGVVKLTDFGLARSITSRLSGESLLVGTVLYMPPEAALGKPVDGRSDLYSLGVMMYEMTTGKLPYYADNPLAVISQHLYSPITSPRTLRPDLPPALDSLIIQLMSKSPEERPASAEDVRHRLELLQNLDYRDTGQPIGEAHQPLLDQLARSRLIGREREITEISALWQRASAGESVFLFITGEPGIGKTRLTQELAARASLTASKAYVGDCYAEGNTPYAPFRQIIKDSFDETDAASALPEYVMADLITIAPELRDRYPQVHPNVGIDPLSEQQHIFESVVAWCATLAAKTPLLLIIEDIHWADSATLFLLRHIARRARKLRMLVMMTYREAEAADSCCLVDVLHDFNRERLATQLKLSRFDREQTRLLLASMMGSSGEIDANLVNAIFHETEGNPFFIEEVCRALIEEDKLRFVNQCWVADDVEGMNIPQSIRITVQTRLARLPERAQEVLVMAAILGREFDLEILKRAAEVDEDTLIAALEAAEKAQIIYEVPRRKGSSLNFSFAHGLIPSSLRDSINGLRRQRLHHRAALAIEATRTANDINIDALAYHFAQAGDEKNALCYSSQAADRALSVYANQEAERYFRQSLEWCKEPIERAYLLSNLGEALFRQVRFGEAEDVWAQAIEIYKQEGDFDNLVQYYARRARAAWYAGDPARGLNLCKAGLAAVPTPMQTPGMAALLHETARAYLFNNMPEEALPLCQKALEMAKRLGLVEVEADALSTLGILSNLSLEEGRAALQQAVELADQAGLFVIGIRAHTNLAEHYRNIGRLGEGRQHMLRASELARRAGILPWQYAQLALAVEIAIDMGDLDFIESKMPELRLLASVNNQPGSSLDHLQVIEGRLEFQKGNWDSAVQIFQSCTATAPRQDKLWVLTLLSEALIERNRFAEVEAMLSGALQEPQDLIKPEYVVALLQVCRLNIISGNLEEAACFYQDAVHIVQETKSLEFYPPLATLSGALRLAEARMKTVRREWEAAFSAFQETADLTQRIGMPWERGRILVEWADCLLASEDSSNQAQPDTRVQALERLQEASNLFQSLKSQAYVDLVNDKMKRIVV